MVIEAEVTVQIVLHLQGTFIFTRHNLLYITSIFIGYSFFPNVLQPIIAMLVNPVHLCCLKIGVIKRTSPQAATALQSVNVTIPGVADPQNIERRRQIALKALSERLSKTTDLQRQNQLPKSIPLQGSAKHFSKHQHFHAGADNLMTFTVPAIPLPPPPVSETTASITSSCSTNLVDIEQTTMLQDSNSINKNPSSTYDINP